MPSLALFCVQTIHRLQMSLIQYLKQTRWYSHLTQNSEVNQCSILAPSCLLSLHTCPWISQILAGSIVHIQKDQ